MHTLRFSKTFDKNLSTLVRKNRLLKKKVVDTLETMMQNLSHPSLRTHKVQTKNHGKKWSVSVDEKIRIIWDFDTSDATCILLLDIGSHKVYR